MAVPDSCARFTLGLAIRPSRREGHYLRDYYGDYGEYVLKGLQSTPEQLKESLRAFAAIGTDEMMIWPTIPEIEQLDLLRAAIPREYFQ